MTGSSWICSRPLVPVIELSGVGKRYWKLDQPAMLLRSVLPFARPERHEMWALRGLDLTVDDGETVGIIGRNGAGKTTLLRVLAGVTRPTEGRVRVSGRIAPLISLGVGFHQEMSGRENVLVNGMLLGLTARQVRDVFESIVDFAELWDFIDTPVKFYSSGMLMRLGFAVLVHIKPDVLLVDEVLAVGDGAFQAKCFDEMRALQERGASIVMVSHSMLAIRHLCSRGILIAHGNVDFDGDIDTAIARHLALMSDEEAPSERSGAIVIDRVLSGLEGPTSRAGYGDDLELTLRLRFTRPVTATEITLAVYSETGLLVSLSAAAIDPSLPFQSGDEHHVAIRFTAALGGGSYRLAVEVKEGGGLPVVRSDGLLLYVLPRAGALGLADVCPTFAIDGTTVPT